MAMTMWTRDRLYLAVLCGHAPTDDEWNRWIALGVRREPFVKRVLVEAHGGGPTVKQRMAMRGTDLSKNARIAILTESTLARGIVTAVSWFGVSLRAFPIDGHELAAQFLELTVDELKTALEVLPGLRMEAGLTSDQAQV